MLMRIDDRRRMADQFEEAIVLRVQLRLDLFGTNLLQIQAGEEVTQRQQAAVGTDEVWHALQRRDRRIESKTGMPAHLEL